MSVATILTSVDWTVLDENGRRALLERPAVRASASTSAAVGEIISKVRQQGDAALLELTARFDGVELKDLAVGPEEAAAAPGALSPEALKSIEFALGNLRKFHTAQASRPIRVETMPGVVCERVSRPLRAVGLYVPAGGAPLPSTAMMLGVPAEIAGCPLRILCTPPGPDGRADPAVVVAARACGIERIYKVGGAQAIAAMAYGTESIPKVDKIFGPGNAWVTAAKQAVALDAAGAAYDMPAGPSEVMVIADHTANPRFVALDLLSQAEHGPDSQVLLVTTDSALIDRVRAEMLAALSALPRREIMEKSLRHSAAILVSDLAEAMDIANRYAPEHLILQLVEPRMWVEQIWSAGSVFLGQWTPESVGDYCSGTNHVLPTYGYARSYSGLSVADFERRMTMQELTREGLGALADAVTTLAGLEGLQAHAQAVRVRITDSKDPRQ